MSISAKARGFSMMVVMPIVVLFGLLVTATFHLVLDQRHRTSLTADRALAKYGAEMALNAAEYELSVVAETPTNLECMATLSRERIATLEPDSRRGFLMGARGSDASLRLRQPQPDQSLWMLVRLLDITILAIEIDVRLPGTLRTTGRIARYVIELIPDRWHSQTRYSDDTPPLWSYHIMTAGFGADPAVNVVLQTALRPRVPRHTSAPQTTTEAAPSIIRPSGTVIQCVYTISDQHDAAAPHSQAFILGRLN